MRRTIYFSILLTMLWMLACTCVLFAQESRYGINDTIISEAIVYDGDTIEFKTLENVYLYTRLNEAQLSDRAKYNRLRNAVYVTYPYARRAGIIMNDINGKLVNITSRPLRRKYIQSREKELKKEFTTPLTNLSIYQGKVLMKLINRETGNNCYEIIKEYKGSVNARLYQTVAFFFNSNLKQAYDGKKDDQLVEKFVKEVQRMHGYQDISKPMVKITAM
ncbi:MAG: DUF4294 domain-containing protein [Ferruginibacter sp.]